jgi:hypothetical protein
MIRKGQMPARGMLRPVELFYSLADEATSIFSSGSSTAEICDRTLNAAAAFQSG